jgi:signal transduction histidine kinase
MKYRLSSIGILFLFLFCGLYTAVAHAEAIFVAPKTLGQPISIVDHVSFLEDMGGTLSLNEAIARSDQFQPVNQQSRGFGYTHSTFWLRFTIDFTHYAESSWFLIQDYEHNHSTTLYTPIQTPNAFQKLFDHQFVVRNELFPIQKPTFTGPATYYVRVTPTIGTNVNVFFYFATQRNTIEQVQNQSLAFGLFFGSLGILFLYNLFLLFATRNRGYLLYLYYLGPFIITFYFINGYAVLVHGPSALLSNISRIAVFASLHGMVMFARYFLALRHFAPKLDAALHVCSWVLVTCLVLFGFVIHIEWAYLTSALLILPIFTIVLAAAYYRLFQGYGPAKIYCFGWTFLVVSMFMYATQVMGLISANAFTNYGLQIGAVVEALCFSIALAARIRTVESEIDLVKKEKQKLIDEKYQYDMTLLENQRKSIEAQYNEQADKLHLTINELAKHKLHIEKINVERKLLIDSINSKIEHERRRIAYDLHDSLNTVIVTLIGQARSIRQYFLHSEKASAIKEALLTAASIEKNSSYLYSTTRNLMIKLWPEVLDEFGLGVSLQSLVIEQNKLHQQCAFHAQIADNFPMFNAEFNIVTYRIAQESIFNVIQHSQATYCLVQLSFEQHDNYVDVSLQITDNGIGFNLDDSTSSVGLVGIRERAQSVNGQIQILTRPKFGTIVTFSCIVSSINTNTKQTLLALAD